MDDPCLWPPIDVSALGLDAPPSWPRPHTRRIAKEYFYSNGLWTAPVASHWQFSIASPNPGQRSSGFCYATVFNGEVIAYPYAMINTLNVNRVACIHLPRETESPGPGEPELQLMNLWLYDDDDLEWNRASYFVDPNPFVPYWRPDSRWRAGASGASNVLPRYQCTPTGTNISAAPIPANGPDTAAIPWPPFDSPFV